MQWKLMPVSNKYIQPIAFILVFALCAITGVAPASAQSIAILVNDQAITDYDIAQRTRLLQLTGASGNARQRATEELIEERLKMQEAKRIGVSVSDEEVNRALAGIAERTGTGTVSRLAQALGSSGVNIGTLKDRFRAEIAWSQVVRQRFQREVQIRDADVLAALRGKGEDAEDQKTMEYDLNQVIVVVPANASNTLLAQRKRDAQKIAANISSCANVRSVASAFRDVTVREVGSRTRQQLDDTLGPIIEATPIGRATAPSRQQAGFELFVVCDRREVTGFEAARSPIESELRNERGMILARRLLRDLRADALIEYR